MDSAKQGGREHKIVVSRCRALLKSAEAMKQCEVHEDVWIDQDDPGAREEALLAATAAVAAGDLVLPTGLTVAMAIPEALIVVLLR